MSLFKDPFRPLFEDVSLWTLGEEPEEVRSTFGTVKEMTEVEYLFFCPRVSWIR